MGAADNQRGTGDAGKFVGYHGVGEHAIDGGKTLRVIGQPAGAELAEVLGVVPDFRRVGVGDTLVGDATHALGFSGCGATQRCLSAIRRDAGGGLVTTIAPTRAA